MNNNHFQLPPSVLNSLKMFQQQQLRLDAHLEPIRRQQAQIEASLAPVQAQIDYLNQFASTTYAPIMEFVNRYQNIVDSIISSIPDLDNSAIEIIDRISPMIHEMIQNDSFPLIPSDEWTEQDYSDFVNQEIENAIGPDIISDIHQSNEESPSNVPSNSDPTDVVDNSFEHSNLHSDLTSSEWHVRIWVEGIYSFIIQLIFAYLAQLITYEAFITAINGLIDLFNNN